MRRRLALLVGATTSLVLVAFLVPLGVLVRDMAADRAVGAATRDAQTVAQILATVDRQTLLSTLDILSGENPGGDKFPVTIFLADGTTLGKQVPESPAVELARSGRSITADTAHGREVLIAAGGLPGGTAVVRTYISNARLAEGVPQAWLILGALGICLLAVGLAVADRLGRAYVRSLGDLDETARRLGSGDLEARADPGGPPELVAVGSTLNTLADRIRDLLTAERERIADLSHRIRTPLTVLRIDAESLSSPQDARRISDDIVGLERAVNEVIRDARTVARVDTSCDTAAVTRERLEFWRVLAEEERRTVRDFVAGGPLPAAVSAEDLAACVDAMLANVFAHTPEGTAFGVVLRPTEDGVLLVVDDDGPGIANAETVLRRGASGAGSTGLGLDIVRRTAEAVGGRVRIGRSPAGGAAVIVDLPRAAT